MRFIETPVFTRTIVALLDDEEYHCLQLALLQRPERGALIRRSGGLRKMRWALPGQGKRGGLRLLYLLGRGERNLLHALRLPEERARGPHRPATPRAKPSGSGGIRMRKQDFENLVESTKQAGRIRRG